MCPPELFTEQSGSAADATTAADTIPPYVPRHAASREAYALANTHLRRSIFHHSLRVYLHAKALATHEASSWSHACNLPALFIACALHDIGTAAQFDGPQRFEVEGADAAAALLRPYSTSHDSSAATTTVRISNTAASDDNATTTTATVSTLKFTPEVIHDIWQAIALHTTPGIAERISPLARIVRLAVLIDFAKKPPAPIPIAILTSASAFLAPLGRDDGEPGRDEDKNGVAAIHAVLPRLVVEKELGDAVVAQALWRREKGAGEERDKAPPASWPGGLLRAKLEEPVGWEGVNRAF